MYPASAASTTVGALINGAIQIDGDSAILPTKDEESSRPIEGCVSEADNCQLIEFGEFTAPEPTQQLGADRSNHTRRLPHTRHLVAVTSSSAYATLFRAGR